MFRLIQSISKRLPRRRRRLWKYVSPRRHGAGVLTLALLTLMLYGYWAQTNDRRVKDRAEGYLEKLTGARIKIERASFSFFGGIELENVRFFVPDVYAPEPFFRAKAVNLRHMPWRLLGGRTIKPYEIVCTEPTVMLEYETDSESYSAQRLLTLLRKRQKLLSPGEKLDLPAVKIRKGKLAVIDLVDGVRQPAGEVDIEVSMVPQGDENYSIIFEDPRGGENSIRGHLVINLTTGHIDVLDAVLPFEKFNQMLPRRYRRWSERYNLVGTIVPVRGPVEGGDDVFAVKLSDVSMRLPPDQGELEMTGVSGVLEFDQDGVSLRDMKGRIIQTGDATFEISGRYEGYDADSPYKLNMSIRGMSIPKAPPGTGGLSEALSYLQTTYQPEGPLDVTISLSRSAGGKLSYDGLIEPQDMSIVLKDFPYRVEHLTGTMKLSPGLIEIEKLTGSHAGGRFVIKGKASRSDGRTLFDVTVDATDITVDQQLTDAVPPKFRRVWDAMSPAGTGGAYVHVYSKPCLAKPVVDMTVKLDGRASITYDKFPYRLDNLVGEAFIGPGEFRIIDISGSRGPATCRINGLITGTGDPNTAKVKIEIEGKNIPLDKTLADAIGEGGHKALAELQPEGQAAKFTASIWRNEGEKLDFSVHAVLEDATFTLAKFPYRLEHTKGDVSIHGKRVVLENLTGTHGDSVVKIGGQAFFDDEQLGLDISISGDAVEIDEHLGKSMPDQFKRIWEDLSPSGKADVDLWFQHNLPDSRGKLDYKLTLTSRDMNITYRGFPYPLRHVRGNIIATPGKVLLQKLVSTDGKMTGFLDGEFLPGEKGDIARLVLKATNVPIDETLIKALPAEFATFAERFTPGGTVDIDLKKLEFVTPHEPTTNATTRPAVSPGGKPALSPGGKWNVEGSVIVRAAKLNIGFGTKTVTGKIAGTAKRNGQGLALDATANLDSIQVGNHRVTDVRAKLQKSSKSTIINVSDLEARSHGGAMSGVAQVDLTDPLAYGISLSVIDVKLDELFYPPGTLRPEGQSVVPGLLDGRIELIDTSVGGTSRQASGVLRISGAKLYKLPILLDVLTVMYLTLPGDAAFEEGEFLYHLRGNKLNFQEIYLRGSKLSVVGSGTMEMDTQKIKLTFISSPGRLPRLRGLAGEVVQGILGIQVTGTLTDPKFGSLPLNNLDQIIRVLIPADE